MATPPQPAKPTPSPADLVDATRRTHLASERTQLAWWRTGLAALAVALGVGRVLPELDPSATGWPYVVAGVGFALWGSSRSPTAAGSERPSSARSTKADTAPPGPWPLRALTWGGVGLGLLTALLIAFD